MPPAVFDNSSYQVGVLNACCEISVLAAERKQSKSLPYRNFRKGTRPVAQKTFSPPCSYEYLCRICSYISVVPLRSICVLSTCTSEQ
jgi:hypothetical protein